MPNNTEIGQHIKAHIASVYKITIKQMLEGQLWWPDVEARYICFWMFNEFLFTDVNQNRRLKLIAQNFNQNRNTVRYGIKKINTEWLSDIRFQKSFDEIKMFVKSKILTYGNINN